MCFVLWYFDLNLNLGNTRTRERDGKEKIPGRVSSLSRTASQGIF
jgi:hypothetical protein